MIPLRLNDTRKQMFAGMERQENLKYHMYIEAFKNVGLNVKEYYDALKTYSRLFIS